MDSIYMKITLFDDHDKFEHYHLIDKNITNVYNKQFDLLSARCYWYKINFFSSKNELRTICNHNFIGNLIFEEIKTFLNTGFIRTLKYYF
jgi:hypothetical protein